MYDDLAMVYFSHMEDIMETKKCSGCERELPLSLFSKDKYQKSGYRCKCKGCSSIEFKSYSTTENYTQRLARQAKTRQELKETNPIKRWAHAAFHNAKKRAKENELEFSITKQWLEENAVTICPLLEVPLVYNADKSTANVASVDRKDSSKGYTPDNCSIISFKANRIKTNATTEELVLLVKNMSTY